MTDKVQKIREEVERLQNELIQEKKKGFCSDVDDACILELQNVLTYIDSLQEESVSEECEGSSFEDACMEKPAYIAGYHQAEKDLSDISWIKEISGVKEISRAKEEALKAYPPQSIAANYATINRRDAFEYGYLKAEKDLKGALVVEIEERYNECLKRAKITDSDYWNAKADAYRNVLTLLNNILEVKECEEESYVTKKVGSCTTTTKIIKKGEKV